MGLGWIQVIVPIVLLIIMMCMGLELVPADFRRIVEIPKPVLIGLAGQILMLPLLGLGVAHALDLSAPLAMGMMVIVSCPGGAPSNIFTYLAGANLALSISLTACSSVITIATIPLWVNFASRHFLGHADEISLPLGRTFGQLFVVTLLPIGIGMAVRQRRPEFAARWKDPLKRATSVMMVVVAAVIVRTQWDVIIRDMEAAAKGAIVLVMVALVVGYTVARLMRLDRRDAFTVSIEVSLQNGALATLIIINLLDQPELLVFPGSYALLAFIPVAAWTFYYRASSSRVS